MISFWKPVLLGTAAFAVASISPIPEPLSPALLRMLDPSAALGSACGGRRGDGAAMRHWISLASAHAKPINGAGDTAPPLIEGLGRIAYPISTGNPEAQRYFDQGLALMYGFNHAAAIGSFRHAQTLDPSCAMCFWGEAYAHGPNINAPMDPEANARALASAGEAMRLRGGATPAERALIEAMSLRYASGEDADRAALDKRYADAMLAVASRFPSDNDIAVLAAESVMDTRPWDYWEADGRTPKGDIGRAIALVEGALARNPDHPQADHLYIHLVEASASPARAEPFADRLATPLMPAAGHMVHMPGHIYYRLGRWKDSIRANIAAARADEAFLKLMPDDGFYRFGYYPHNVHFLLTSAQMAGDLPTVLTEAKRLSAILNPDITAELPWVQPVDAAPYFAYAQFATPEQAMALPPPDARLPYVTAMWRYARAVAQAERGDEAAFDRELAEIRRIRTTTDFTPMVEQLVPAPDLLRIAEEVATARMAFARKDYASAAGHYRKAITLKDSISYYEPPFWYYPIRQSLGAVLYSMGDREGARRAFQDALVESPNNAWALWGLARAQQALGDQEGEQATMAAFGRAWLGDPAWLKMSKL